MLLHHSQVLVPFIPVILSRSIRFGDSCGSICPCKSRVEVCLLCMGIWVVVCGVRVELALQTRIVAVGEVSVMAEVFLAKILLGELDELVRGSHAEAREYDNVEDMF